MKLRATFLVFASLLLMGSLASAGQTATPADPTTAILAAIFSVPASPGGAAKLPSFQPTPSNQALSDTCGECSDELCSGKLVGTLCLAQNNTIWRCQHAISYCSARDCECWTGPLP